MFLVAPRGRGPRNPCSSGPAGCAEHLNKCMPSAGGPPDIALPTLLQELRATRRCDCHTYFKHVRTYVPSPCIVPVKGGNKNIVYICFALVFFRLPKNGSGLRDWSSGVELWVLGNALGHWALGTGEWGFSIGRWALCTGHWALGIVGLPTADSKRERKRPAAKSLKSQSGERRLNIKLFLLCISPVMIPL